MTEWDKQFDPGKYMYIINLTDGRGIKWSFVKNFEIKSEVAEKLNRTSIDTKESFIKKYLTYLIILMPVLLIVFLSLILNKYFRKISSMFIKSKNFYY